MNKNNNKAILLFSGGLDSTTILYYLKNLNYQIYALSFNYGQRQETELKAAKKTIASVGEAVVEHKVINIDLKAFGGSALTDHTIAFPIHQNRRIPKIESKNNNDHSPKAKPTIPITYVPARNTIFISFALAYAEVTNANEIFVGVNSMDYSGYPDCRPEYIAKFNELITLGTADTKNSGIKIQTPLQHLTKAEIIKLGIANGAEYSTTFSCYNPTPTGYACGICDACGLRLAGFKTNNIPDPIQYSTL